MRILYDSQQTFHKEPFGTLTPGRMCTLHIHIPQTVQTTGVQCVLLSESGQELRRFPFVFSQCKGAYEIWQCTFSLGEPGLYFYYFHIDCIGNHFRLFKAGCDTNMEAGDWWQLSCIPQDFTTPDWAKGALIYQIFPDRFRTAGQCDLTGKLEPYTLHRHWDEEVSWQPTPEGAVLNNDFYGGNFRGITQKMDYLASLGVGIIYLNPISKSFSSHRYDTGDYKTPDPMLGTQDDFREMCDAAHARNIRVVLDGVFSHTGSNSLYFNREGAFGAGGAFRDPQSPYRSWYTFQEYPHRYTSWWNFDTLPTVNKANPGFIDYIITGEDSVVSHWLKLGADGFRLDVVDELPDGFVSLLKRTIRRIKPDALLIGEVWEDASNKIAYGQRRRYFVDGELDSCMNYPFRTAILNFLRHHDDGRNLKETVMTILENYPPQVWHCNMNLLGTHDTPRILTALVDDFDGPREQAARRFLSDDQRKIARNLLMMASFLQFMLPGAPSIYYGDEAGMEGHKDPFNRRTYPWGKEDNLLLQHFRNLGKLRQEEPVLRLGDVTFFQADSRRIGFSRTWQGRKLNVYVNHSEDIWEIPAGTVRYSRNLQTLAPNWLQLGSMGFCVTEDA